MTKDEALKMAIDQLWSCSMLMNLDHSDYLYEDVIKAHDACKEALEQPAQEPVAWIKDWADKSREIVPDNYDNSYPVYTHPAPSWQGNKEFVGLSDDEIEAIDDVTLGDYYEKQDAMYFARAIEQELKTKNGFSGLKEKNT